tara:strand:- start:1626 stop:2627 length:1002 start_codon:yes stop_codon:yes gene_type:complete
MSAYKQFNAQDLIVSPFEVNKSFSFIGSEATSSNVGIQYLKSKQGNYIGNQNDLTGGTTEGTTEIPQVLLFSSIQQLYYSNYISGSGGFTGNATTASVVLGATSFGDRLIGRTQQTNYYNYEQTTLWPSKFFNTHSAAKLNVISIPQKLFGDYIQPNSFVWGDSVDTSKQLIDDGEGRLKQASTGDYVMGNIIYDYGIITFFNSKSDGTVLNLASKFNAPYNNVTCSFSSSYKIFETQYKATINEDEFNYTTNPTIITGSQIPTVFSGSNIDWENTASVGTPLGFATSSYFTPYITTVGLYDDNFNLLAVGKLATPLQSSPTTDTTILVNIDR